VITIESLLMIRLLRIRRIIVREFSSGSSSTEIPKGALVSSPLPGDISSPSPTGKTKREIIASLKEEDIEENFIRGSGKGGQKVNVTSSTVQVSIYPPKVLTIREIPLPLHFFHCNIVSSAAQAYTHRHRRQV
jgi:hypothetical protein